MNWPISWQNVKDHIDDIQDGIPPELLPPGGVGYSETETVYIIKETELPKKTDNMHDATFEKQLVDGETYIIVFDGVEYERTCVYHAQSGAKYLGNPDLFGTDDSTGEPFCVEQSENSVFVEDTSVAHTVSVYQKKETVHPIDPKYLPGICLPVVELNIDALIGEGTFTDAENAALTACIGMPFILKSGNSTVSTSMVMEYNGGGNEHIFANGNITFRTNNGGETWTVINA